MKRPTVHAEHVPPVAADIIIDIKTKSKKKMDELMTQPVKLSGPVWRSAMNHPKDVMFVQQLLNGHIQRDPCRKRLKVDGKWSQELERTIATFQQLASGPVMTEGRMEPRTRRGFCLR